MRVKRTRVASLLDHLLSDWPNPTFIVCYSDLGEIPNRKAKEVYAKMEIAHINLLVHRPHVRGKKPFEYGAKAFVERIDGSLMFKTDYKTIEIIL